MAKGVYIIGTDTEVGKTVISAGLMTLLMGRGMRAAYFKPVASGEIEDETGFHPADYDFVRRISGFMENEQIVSPFSYREAVAPHLAARWAGKPILKEAIRERLAYLKKSYEVIVAEAAGGLAVPLNDAGYMQFTLIRELGFPCGLVARAGLGTINHTLLTLSLARREGLKVTSLFINQFNASPLEEENVAIIRRLSGIENIFVIPTLSELDGPHLRSLFHDLIRPEALASIFTDLPEADGE